MTTKKAKLAILGAPLRKAKYGWTAKTKLGTVELTESVMKPGSVFSGCMSLGPAPVGLGTFADPISVRAAAVRCERRLRAIHKACQVEL